MAFEGYIPGATGGRTDNKDISVGNGAFVIPADVLSGVGEGNSIAGAHAFHKMLKMDGRITKQNGGAAEDAVPIVAASGEMVVPPDKVKELGGGDLEHGHNLLDALVVHLRKKTIRHLQKLPKPRKN